MTMIRRVGTRVKHRLETLVFFASLAPFALPFKADGLGRITEIIPLLDSKLHQRMQ